MVLGFISKGLTSKHVKLVLDKQINSFSSRKEKLARDIGYMRRQVNELYFMKIKPVYAENEDFEYDQEIKGQSNVTIRRSCSLPADKSLRDHRSSSKEYSPVRNQKVTSDRHSAAAKVKLRSASESNVHGRDFPFRKLEKTKSYSSRDGIMKKPPTECLATSTTCMSLSETIPHPLLEEIYLAEFIAALNIASPVYTDPSHSDYKYLDALNVMRKCSNTNLANKSSKQEVYDRKFHLFESLYMKNKSRNRSLSIV